MNRRFVEVSGGPVEVLEWQAPTAGEQGRTGEEPIILLHEGLGSASQWGGFSGLLAEATGRRVVAWSRHGYGWSASAPQPRDASYMHREALVILPELLDTLGARRPLLVGHSDGASIALIHAGSGHPVAGVVALAPHVVVEDRSLEGIRAIREKFETTDLAARLSRYHSDAHATFFGWNDVWLSAGFRQWSIEDCLAGITAPVLAVQCADDAYGTLSQIDRIETGVAGPFRRLVFGEGGHAPQSSHPGEVVDGVVQLCGRAKPRNAPA